MIILENGIQCFGYVIDKRTGESLVTILTPSRGNSHDDVAHYWCDHPQCSGNPTAQDWFQACMSHGFAFDQSAEPRAPFRPPVTLDKAGLISQLKSTLDRFQIERGVDIRPDDTSKLTSNLLQSAEEAEFHNRVQDLIAQDQNALLIRPASAEKMITTVAVDLDPAGTEKVVDTCVAIEMGGADGKSKTLRVAVHTNIYRYEDGGFESFTSFFLNEAHYIEHIHTEEITKGWTIGFSVGAGIVAPALNNGTNISIGDPVHKDGKPATTDPTVQDPDTGSGPGNGTDPNSGSDPGKGGEGGVVIGPDSTRSNGLSFSVEFGRTKSKMVRKEFRDFIEKNELDESRYMDRRKAFVNDWRLTRGLA